MNRYQYLDKKKGPSSNPLPSIGGHSSSGNYEKPEASACKQDRIQDFRRLKKIIDHMQKILRPKQVGKILEPLKDCPLVVFYCDLTFDQSTIERISKDPGVLGLHYSSRMSARKSQITSEIIRVYYLQGKNEYDFLPFYRFSRQSIVYYNGAESDLISLDDISEEVIACIWIWEGFFEIISTKNEPVLRQELEDVKESIARLTTEVRKSNEDIKNAITKISDRNDKLEPVIHVILELYEQQKALTQT